LEPDLKARYRLKHGQARRIKLGAQKSPIGSQKVTGIRAVFTRKPTPRGRGPIAEMLGFWAIWALSLIGNQGATSH
jgi:hypothetical protein